MTTDAETMDAAEAEERETSDPAGEALAVTFDDLSVLSEGGIEVFVLNLELAEANPPYFIEVAGRRFAYSSITFLLKGHSAALPAFVREHEAEGRLVLLVQRRNRYIAYVHDPAAGEDAEEQA